MTKEEALKLRDTPTDNDEKPLVTRETKPLEDELTSLIEVLGCGIPKMDVKVLDYPSIIR